MPFIHNYTSKVFWANYPTVIIAFFLASLNWLVKVIFLFFFILHTKKETDYSVSSISSSEVSSNTTNSSSTCSSELSMN